MGLRRAAQQGRGQQRWKIDFSKKQVGNIRGGQFSHVEVRSGPDIELLKVYKNMKTVCMCLSLWNIEYFTLEYIWGW